MQPARDVFAPASVPASRLPVPVRGQSALHLQSDILTAHPRNLPPPTVALAGFVSTFSEKLGLGG